MTGETKVQRVVGTGCLGRCPCVRSSKGGGVADVSRGAGFETALVVWVCVLPTGCRLAWFL